MKFNQSNVNKTVVHSLIKKLFIILIVIFTILKKVYLSNINFWKLNMELNILNVIVNETLRQ